MTSRTFEQGTDGRPGAEARHGDRPRGEARCGERTLADLTPSATTQVVSVSVPGSPAVARRLADLGFTPGAKVATLGQVAAAEDPEDPGDALRAMTYSDGPRAGQPIFTAPTIAALLVYFAFALQCMATVGVIRREIGTWRWPLVAFGYLTVTAWLLAYLARTVTAIFVG